MKGTEKIIGHIRSDAEAKVSEIIAAAEEECAKIKADSEASAKAAYAEKIRAGVKECEARNLSFDRICRMEAKKSILSLKQEMISAAFDLAVEKLANLPEEQYMAFLSKLACEAAGSGDEYLLVLNERDRAAIGEKLTADVNAKLKEKGSGAMIKLSGETGEFAGGFVLRRGNVETNCAVELLVDLCRSEMSSTVAGVLFD